MEKKMSHDAFVSFSFKDGEIANKIASILAEKYGITYWICTRDITAGERYKETIVDAIDACQVVILFQSANSMSSVEVPKEISLALSKRKKVIPFKLDQSRLSPALEYDLLTVQFIDATRPPIEDRIHELALHISTVTGKPLKTSMDVNSDSVNVVNGDCVRIGEKNERFDYINNDGTSDAVKYTGKVPCLMLEEAYLSLRSSVGSQAKSREMLCDLKTVIDALKYSKPFGASDDAQIIKMEIKLCSLIEKICNRAETFMAAELDLLASDVARAKQNMTMRNELIKK